VEEKTMSAKRRKWEDKEETGQGEPHKAGAVSFGLQFALSFQM